MTTYVDPTREQFSAMMGLDSDEPLCMLNLLRFRDIAAYDDDHANAGKGLSGAQAYAAYGKESGPIFAGVGGKIAHRWSPRLTLIGPSNEAWDLAFVATYPNAGAFAQMVKDPAYQIAVKHRQAAVLDSRLVRMVAIDNDGTF